MVTAKMALTMWKRNSTDRKRDYRYILICVLLVLTLAYYVTRQFVVAGCNRQAVDSTIAFDKEHPSATSVALDSMYETKFNRCIRDAGFLN